MKIKNLIFLAGMAGLCACGKGTHTQKAYDFAPLDSIISGWMDKGYYPGGAVCVMKDDSVLFGKTMAVLRTARRCMWLRPASG